MEEHFREDDEAFYSLIQKALKLPHETGIYFILCTPTRERYIGATKRWFGGRIITHLKQLRNERHPTPKLQNRYDEYGAEGFDVGVLECIKTMSAIGPAECRWINEYAKQGLSLNGTWDSLYGVSKKKVTIDIEADLWDRLKTESAKRQQTRPAFIAKLLDEGLRSMRATHQPKKRASRRYGARGPPLLGSP